MTVLTKIKDAVAANQDKRLQVKLYKSIIGLPRKLKGVTQVLGLKRTHQTVFLKITPYTVGQLVKLKELIKIKLIGVNEMPARNYLKTPPGFIIIGNMLNANSI